MGQRTLRRSNTTGVSVSAPTEVNGITFTLAASNPYTITSVPSLFSGAHARLDCGRRFDIFFNSATAESHTTFTTEGSAFSAFGNVGDVAFFDESSAGSATIINNGGTVANARGGVTEIGVFLSDTRPPLLQRSSLTAARTVATAG